MKSIFIANWKMNLLLDGALKLMSHLMDSLKNQSDLDNVIIAPPLPYISTLSKNYPRVNFASQDVSVNKNFGAHTGEVSAKMIKSSGGSYAILGHSERRVNFGDTNQVVNKKLANCLDASIIPILCIGEPIESRGQKNHLSFLEQQLAESLGNITGFDHIIIAYEPIWAIGTKIVPTIAEIEEVSRKIKEIVASGTVAKKIDLVYGGSVNSANHNDILSAEGISGVLVGSASLYVDEATSMIKGQYKI